jgi:hypothetical protein
MTKQTKTSDQQRCAAEPNRRNCMNEVHFLEEDIAMLSKLIMYLGRWGIKYRAFGEKAQAKGYEFDREFARRLEKLLTDTALEAFDKYHARAAQRWPSVTAEMDSKWCQCAGPLQPKDRTN